MKFKFSLASVLSHREVLERNAEIALGKEVQKQVALEAELQALIDEYKGLVQTRGGINTKSAEGFEHYVSYASRLKVLSSQKKAEIDKQKQEVEKARKELIKKTQEKKAIEVLRDSQKAAFKLAEKRMEAKQTDEAATQLLYSRDQQDDS
ncbi:MAG: flagellar export protein FliJ [Fibromonadaceae bacterium]|jgi:flagellar FliJ protein|nr:flagellar export protein FliJ [Fibromonadaceae bacterium]